MKLSEIEAFFDKYPDETEVTVAGNHFRIIEHLYSEVIGDLTLRDKLHRLMADSLIHLGVTEIPDDT